MDKVKLGIIGFGNMGSGHTRDIMEGKCPEIDLVAICDIKPEREDWIKENVQKEIVFFTIWLELLLEHCLRLRGTI